ncbi:hypothetical protein E4U09_005764 [Claviceps aff. purpurea]|uniref:Uncharacterized protein n=1 Tax=Claviceps aff. purpurea TaxID=1967640 RepID=A0A9P7U707_9HYPO|nr:hypothetical protein E4U09_005764 [Claviceps aff. purpurea]
MGLIFLDVIMEIMDGKYWCGITEFPYGPISHANTFESRHIRSTRPEQKTIGTSKSPTADMPQIVAPLAISPPRNNSRLFTSQDLFSSLTANLRHKDNRPSTLLRHMPEDDYSVPAPPPPSPVSFRADKWHMPTRH